MQTRFGERIRTLREAQNLYLRQVASQLDMDTAQLSKIENGFRHLKKDQIALLAEILNTQEEELLTLWLADKIVDITKGEDVALRALQLAETEIITQSSNNAYQ